MTGAVVGIQWPDDSRACLYREPLERGLRALVHALEKLPFGLRPDDPWDCLRETAETLARQLDETVLPTTVLELVRARADEVLDGDSPEDRYRSFWRRRILSPTALSTRYPLVHGGVTTVVDSSVAALRTLISRLDADLPLLRRHFPGVSSGLQKLKLVGSDRHAGGGQVALLVFADGTRIYYKPVSMASQRLLHDLIERLALSPDLVPRRIRTLDRGDHGWAEEVLFATCEDQDAVRRYWRRSGTLAAVCCLLNFSDGHWENLIAAGEHPVLVDTETLFGNFAWRTPSGRLESLLDTGLVELRQQASPGYGSHAAFQVIGSERFSRLDPFVERERTDELSVRFQRVVHEPPRNLPVWADHFQTVDLYLNDLILGFRSAFEALWRIRTALLADDSFWNRVAAVRSRQVIRESSYYFRLLRLLDQPAAAANAEEACRELGRRLSFDEPTRYDRLIPHEMMALLARDIPYFSHQAAGRDLIVANAHTIQGFFDTTALHQIRANVAEWGEAFVADQCSLLVQNLADHPAAIGLTLVDRELLAQTDPPSLARSGS